LIRPQFEAFEAFLEHFPEWVGNVVLIQVTTPTANDSPVVARKISRLVDHINVSACSIWRLLNELTAHCREHTETWPSRRFTIIIRSSTET
jgi:hypothetical protein